MNTTIFLLIGLVVGWIAGQFLIFLLIGLWVGWIAGQFLQGRGIGLTGNLILGISGSVSGGFLMAGSSNLIIQFVVATVGAIFLIFIFSLNKI